MRASLAGLLRWPRLGGRADPTFMAGGLCRPRVDLPRCFARPDIFPDPCRSIFNACAAAFRTADDIRLR
jgi:hypothetical protein